MLFVIMCYVYYTYLFVIFHFILHRHYVTQRQNTFLFNKKCTCMLIKVGMKSIPESRRGN